MWTIEHLLIVATDRLSAFDVVLPDPIPFKGEVLTQISLFWFGKTAHIAANHLSALRVEDVDQRRAKNARSSGPRHGGEEAQPLPLEAVVRGYLIGSGFKDYKLHGSICGIPLPAGLRMAARLPEPLFTPASKAPAGSHDENIDFDAIVKLVGHGMRQGHSAHRAGGLSIRRRTRARAQHHHRRHEIRIRRRQGRQTVSHRRSVDAGLFALLADGILQAGNQSAELRQAIRARLSGVIALEQEAARAASAAGDFGAHQR